MGIWIIEQSKDAGATWNPLQSVGYKLKRATAEKMVATNNAHYKLFVHLMDWRERAVEYVAKGAE